MSRARAVVIGLILLAAVFITGIVGYVAIEGMSPLEAAYFTTITVTTVGFAEPEGGFSDGGRWFTILILIAGVGAALYTATVGLEVGLDRFLGGERRERRVQRQIDGLSDHIILCGFGIVGRGVYERLRADPHDVDVVVIEQDLERVDLARDLGALCIEGDATHDETLLAAGIERARTVVASVASDSDNLVVVLSAKTRRPDLLVLSRATEAESERKLILAGADRVVAPQTVGAQRLASLAIHPDVAEFIDLMLHGTLVEFRVEQLVVAAGSPAEGRTLRDSNVRRDTGALVIAVQGPDGQIAINPGADFVLEEGQTVFGVGTQEQVERLRTMVTAPR